MKCITIIATLITSWHGIETLRYLESSFQSAKGPVHDNYFLASNGSRRSASWTGSKREKAWNCSQQCTVNQSVTDIGLTINQSVTDMGLGPIWETSMYWKLHLWTILQRFIFGLLETQQLLRDDINQPPAPHWQNQVVVHLLHPVYSFSAVSSKSICGPFRTKTTPHAFGQVSWWHASLRRE